MKESVRIFRFIVIGTMNALIMALVVWLMMKEISFDGDYMVANITAYLIAQIHNFIWCKYWIFPVENKKNSIWKQILQIIDADLQGVGDVVKRGNIHGDLSVLVLGDGRAGLVDGPYQKCVKKSIIMTKNMYDN